MCTVTRKSNKQNKPKQTNYVNWVTFLSSLCLHSVFSMHDEMSTCIHGLAVCGYGLFFSAGRVRGGTALSSIHLQVCNTYWRGYRLACTWWAFRICAYKSCSYHCFVSVSHSSRHTIRLVPLLHNF